jgi:hypothetical protein
MISYKAFTKYFGCNLNDENFQFFLSGIFTDLTAYNVSKSNYIISPQAGIELGFINDSAVYDEDEETVFEKGNPVFSHFNLFPKSKSVINEFPFHISFENNRSEILNKIGEPLETKRGFLNLLNKNFLVDKYETENLIVVFDYETLHEKINFMQVIYNRQKNADAESAEKNTLPENF